jgi:predicted porin
MKKTVFALAVLGAFATAASAQTSVTVYGIVDMGIVRETGGASGSVSRLSSGVESGSRLGFRGTEDLGGGLAANFVLETGIAADAGGFNQGGLAFGRQSYVGLSGGFGALNMGRQYTPEYLTLSTVADPFANGLAGAAGNLMAKSGTRMDNAIKYTTPNLSGFNGEIAYGFGEVAGDTAKSRAVGASVGYAAGPVNVRLGYHNLNNPTASDSTKNTLLAGSYDFGPAKAHLAYGVNKGTGTTDSADWLIGATVPFGPHKILASYIRKNDKTAADKDASQLALGYTYALSKRTDLYAAYARINNRNGALFTVGNNTDTGTGDKAFNLGMRHTF